MARVALLSLHTSPLAQPGTGDSGGMNVYVRELAAGLAHAGHHCDVYVRTSDDGEPAEAAVEPGVRVRHVPAGDPGLAKEDLPAVIDEWADAVGAAIEADGGTDVLHANYWLSGVAGHRLKHALDVPLVSTFHTLARVKSLHGDPEPEARAEAEAAVMACSDAVLASCPAEARQLAELYGVPRERIALVPPGVEHALFSPGPERPGAEGAVSGGTGPERPGAEGALSGGTGPKGPARFAAGLADLGDRPVVLFVGRIQRLKGLDVAVAALDRMWARDAVLVVCGGPSGAEGRAALAEVEAMVAAAGLDERVRFVAPRPHHRLSSLYRAADVVVVPSRSESFGLVALEAAACGRPVVAADVGGLTTLVDHRRTGLLVPGRDPVAWAEALDSVLCFPDRAERMGAAAAEAALRYRWSDAARALAGVYADVTTRGPVDCAA